MPNTVKLKLVARYAIEGSSATSQGADAVSELVTTAYEDMANAMWMRDDSAPTMPVHEYDRARPHGDAYNATWGYESETRSERSCCGAVCYVFQVPHDAIDQTTHGECRLTSVSVRVRGDRYLNSGAVVSVYQSGRVYPVAWDSLINRPYLIQWFHESDPVCATSGQLDPETQEPLNPNNRVGVAENVTLEFPDASTYLDYIHVVLRCQDYLEHRGAWVEGGALIVNAEATAQFSRNVATSELEWACEFNEFVFPENTSVFDLLYNAPLAATIGSYQLNTYITAPVAYTLPQDSALAMLRLGRKFFDTAARPAGALFRYVLGTHASYMHADLHCGNVSQEDGKRIVLDLTVCSATHFGHTMGRTFTAMHLVAPFPPCRVCAYGVNLPSAMVATFDDGTAKTDVPSGAFMPSIRAVLDEAVYNGTATSMEFAKAEYSDGNNSTEVFDSQYSPLGTISIPCRPLFSRKFLNYETANNKIAFDEPWETTDYSAVIVIVFPVDVFDHQFEIGTPPKLL